MCFSPTASFAVAGVLAAIGVASVSRAALPRQRMFAVTPFLFAAQQASEGVIWMTIGDPSHALAQQVAVRLFLGFALVAWPAWVPISLLLIEPRPAPRRTLAILSELGLAASAVSLFLLVHWEPAARIQERSLTYVFGMPTGSLMHLAMLTGYFVPVVAPFFISTLRLTRTIGVLLVVAVLTAALIRAEAMTSVWCFFAAGLSALVLVAVSSPVAVATRAA